MYPGVFYLQCEKAKELCDSHSQELCPQRVLMLRALRKARVFQKLLGSERAGSIQLVLGAYLHRILPDKLLLKCPFPPSPLAVICWVLTPCLGFHVCMSLTYLQSPNLSVPSVRNTGSVGEVLG